MDNVRAIRKRYASGELGISLAKEFGVAIKDIEVVFGQFNVNKQLRIKAPSQLPAVINKQLAENISS